MDLPDHTTTDQRILLELMEFASPGELRRSLLDLFFHCMMTSDPDSYRGRSCRSRMSLYRIFIT